MKSQTQSNKEIARLLRDVAAAYLLRNEIRFKIIAYEKAADTIEQMNRELKDIWKEGKMKGIPGIGPTITTHLEELFKTGQSEHFNSIIWSMPEAIYPLMRVPSIGPKKAFKLVKELKIKKADKAVDTLLKLALDGKIETIEGFGAKSQDEIIKAIQLYKQSDRKSERMPLPYAKELAKQIIAYMKQLEYINHIDAMGSMRRSVSTIGDIDIALSCPEEKTEEVIKHLTAYPLKVDVDNAGAKKASIIVSPNIRIDLRVQEEKSYGSMLQYFTGSKAHNVKLREYALRKGLSLSEWGIKETDTGKLHEFENEETFYAYLDLPLIPPEIREGTNEIDIARKDKLPELVTLKDIKGDLHTHSSYDLKPSHDFGENTYEEMAEKAVSLGYHYIGFSDHNPNTSNNTSVDIINIMKKRREYIDHIFRSKKYDHIKTFVSLECDIMPSGELALPDEAIEYVDYLVVSIHSSFRQDRKTMTDRVLKALSKPKVKIFGHPTGRLLGKREGIELDWDKIFALVKEKNIAFEVNSWPERLDLPDTLVREAVEQGIKLVINTDAHAVSQMDGMEYGVAVARRGWASKHDIMNTLPYSEFKKWILERR